MAQEQEIPKTIGPYQVECRLGDGGMGVVYRGIDENLQRPVAIKVLKESLDSANRPIKRFLREGRMVGRIHHQNVAAVYLLGRDEPSDQLFIAMEYIEGKTLSELVKEQGPLTVEDAVIYVQQAAAGLAAALRNEVIHRDVKPGNIMVTPSGQIKVMDFGLAKLLHMRGDITRTGQILGTFHYLSPEALAGEQCDHRADIYGLGLTLFFLLTGQHPFETKEQTLAVKERLANDVPDIRKVRPDIPEYVAEAIGYMTAQEAEERPASYRTVISLLEQGVAVPPGEETSAPSPERPRSSWAPIYGLAALLLSLLAFFSFPSRKEKTLPPATKAPPPTQKASATVSKPVVTNRAFLTVDVTPKDSRVRVDDKLVPTFTRVKMKPDFYAIKVERQGYKIYEGELQLSAGEERRLDIKLAAAGWVGPERGQNFINSLGMEMVWIPPGQFLMGSPADEFGRYARFEQLSHPVTISRGFWMSKYETTQEQWERLMGSHQSRWRGAKRPVENMTADEYEAFCWQLSANEELRYRLPTEAEWEYACRAGSAMATYGPIDDIAWYGGNSGQQSHEVGTKQANDFGLYDMFGNVGETCRENWLEQRPAVANAIDPQGATNGDERTARGFSWKDPAIINGNVVPFRAALRWRMGVGRNYLVGFRCLCIPLLPPPGKKAARLSLTITPADAEVRVDGFPIKEYKKDYLIAPGHYQLHVQKAGYEVHSQFLFLEYGKKVNVDINLQPK